MGSEVIGLYGLAGLITLLVLRVPVALAMMVVGVVGFAQIISWPAAFSMLKNVPTSVLSSYSFSAIPMFIFMGVLASHSGMAGMLFSATRTIFGGRTGGLAIATVGSCGVFSAVSGSSLATASTMTRVALPEMERYGYHNSLATGTLAAGGTLGIMIPPSIALLIYAVITEQSVGDMFAAGIVPGLMGLLFYGLTIAVVMRLKPDLAVPGEPTSLRTKLRALGGLAPFGIVFLVIILGIYQGVFTPTEGASVGAFVTLCYAWYNGLRLPGLWTCTQEALSLSAVVFFMLAGADVLGDFISVSRISSMVTDYLSGLDAAPVIILLGILLLYFALGMFMDSIAMLVITVPVVFPVITALGIDPVWFGILTVIAVEMGLITPPVGMNVFVIKAMAPHVPLANIYRGVAPFLVAELLRLGILIAFPGLVLWIL